MCTLYTSIDDPTNRKSQDICFHLFFWSQKWLKSKIENWEALCRKHDLKISDTFRFSEINNQLHFFGTIHCEKLFLCKTSYKLRKVFITVGRLVSKKGFGLLYFYVTAWHYQKYNPGLVLKSSHPVL